MGNVYWSSVNTFKIPRSVSSGCSQIYQAWLEVTNAVQLHHVRQYTWQPPYRRRVAILPSICRHRSAERLPVLHQLFHWSDQLGTTRTSPGTVPSPHNAFLPHPSHCHLLSGDNANGCTWMGRQRTVVDCTTRYGWYNQQRSSGVPSKYTRHPVLPSRDHSTILRGRCEIPWYRWRCLWWR